MSFIKFNLKKYVIENDGHIQVIFLIYNTISKKCYKKKDDFLDRTFKSHHILKISLKKRGIQ